MTTITTDVTGLKAAIEARDADAVTAWYAEDAVLTIVDKDHPPASPAHYRGLAEIHGYFADICGRHIDHLVRDLIHTDDGLAFVQDCRYADGTQVVCVTVARLAGGKITSQTLAQAWDA